MDVDVQMKEALKSLTTNNQVDTAFDLRDKNIEKLKKTSNV